MSYTDIDITRSWCKASLLNFTRYMFKKKTSQRFIVGEHHRRICDALDAVMRGECRRLIINIAPRYSKTELVSKNFIAYGLARNPRSRFLHLSYSDDLVLDNSKEVNEIVTSDYYRELFPEVEVTSVGAKKWYTSQRGGVYAVSSAGQVTGFGAGLMDEEASSFIDNTTAYPTTFAGAIIIDDPLKPEDALSDVQRERVNQRFESTIRNRVNSRNTPIIIVMQRLHENDLCGYLQRVEPDEWQVLSLPCLTTDAEGKEVALWEHKHTVEELHHLAEVSPFVFQTQYQQNPQPLEGLMYPAFKEYDTLPIGKGVARNYTDTADTGADFLCSINYIEYPEGLYVTNVLYTNKPMEFTEVETAKMLDRDKVAQARIESNNGGRGFARNVERNLRNLGNRTTTITTFTQTKNKQVRIFTHSAEVCNMVYMPRGWEVLFPAFANAVKSYRKEGRNLHDDAPDALTGIVESIKPTITTRYSRT